MREAGTEVVGTTALDTVEGLLALVEGDLKNYLQAPHVADHLCRVICEETGCSPVLVRFAVKTLGTPAVEHATGAAVRLTGSLVSLTLRGLARLPGVEPVLAALHRRLGRLRNDATARAELDALLAAPPGRRLDPAFAGTLSQDLRLGLRQLAEVEELRTHLDAAFAELLARLAPQPPLTLKLLDLEPGSRLVFGARRLPFLGREAEMAALCDFLDAPAPFAWRLLEGPGGAGKSRLALELCLAAGLPWRAGFHEPSSRFGAWDAWQPETPTLLVVDYVRQRAADVRGLLLTLARRREHAPLDRPVRVLLVERQRDAGWWEPLLEGSEGDAIRQSAYSLDPAAAGDLGPEHRWSIV